VLEVILVIVVIVVAEEVVVVGLDVSTALEFNVQFAVRLNLDAFDLPIIALAPEREIIVRHGGPCVQGEHRHHQRANRQYQLHALHHATSSLCYRNPPRWVATKERLPLARSFGYGKILLGGHGRLSHFVLSKQLLAISLQACTRRER
jgi:hypothetical protein